MKSMKLLSLLLTFLCVTIGFAGDKPAKKNNEGKPNIIFYIADDMTVDMFNCLPQGQGKNKSLTPNLDRIATEGVVMLQQHVAATVCTPSRYNVMTGTYASRATNPHFIEQAVKKNNDQRVVEWNTHVLASDANIAKYLKEGGYQTGAVGKNHVIDVEEWKAVKLSENGNDPAVLQKQKRNYDYTIEAYHKAGFDFAGGIFYENPDFNGPKSLAVHNLDWSTQAALDFIGDSKKNPFFLYFATTVPHGPTDANRSWNADRTIYPLGKLEKAPTCLPDKSTIPTRLKEAGIPVNDKKANLLWMDDSLGALFKKLEEEKKLDNTIIFFFNDHGQAAKGTVYQGAVLNPSLVWKKGGFKIGHQCEAPVSNIDFAPTILDFAGVKPQNPKFDGSSFAPILNGEVAPAVKPMYFEIGYSRAIRKGKYKYLALRYPKWVNDITAQGRIDILNEYNEKLLGRGKEPNNTDPTKPFGHTQVIPGGGDAEFPATKKYPHYGDIDQLYDLEADPNEQHNLYNDPNYAKVVADMRAEMTKVVSTLPGGFGEFKTK